MKLKRKIKIKFHNILILIIVFVFLLAFLMISKFNKQIRPKMMGIVEEKINKLSNDIIMDSFNKNLIFYLILRFNVL